jgi:hypothetical protein
VGMNKKTISVALVGLLITSSWALLMHLLMGNGFAIYLVVGVVVYFSLLGVRGILGRRHERR